MTDLSTGNIEQKPKKNRRLGRQFFLMVFIVFVAVFYAAMHKIDLYATTRLKTLLTEAGIESDFKLYSKGISDWELKDATFTYGQWQVSVPNATAHLSFTKLFSAPVNAMARNVTIHQTTEGSTLGTLDVPEVALMTSPAENGTVTLDVVMNEIIHKGVAKPYFAPLKASVSVKDALMSGDVTSIFLKMGDTLGKWSMQNTVDYTPVDGSWVATAELDPIIFESGLIQPDSLFPILRGHVYGADGSLTFGGKFEQKAGMEKPVGLATLSMNNLSATIEDIEVKSINGSVAINSLSPLTTNGEQTISIGEILIGLPLSEGKIPFTLINNNQVKFGTTSWQWAGGKLRTEPMEVNLNEEGLKGVKLDADKLMLQSLLSGLLKEGLTATGTLEGSFPIAFKNGKPVITNGVLQTSGAGVISYTPSSESGMQKGTSLQTDLLLDAISNFHYEYLRLKIDNIDDEKLLVQLSTRGNNPDLYDGKPIELNINLTGNLFDIARSGTETYAIPKRIQEQFAP